MLHFFRIQWFLWTCHEVGILWMFSKLRFMDFTFSLVYLVSYQCKRFCLLELKVWIRGVKNLKLWPESRHKQVQECRALLEHVSVWILFSLFAELKINLIVCSWGSCDQVISPVVKRMCFISLFVIFPSKKIIVLIKPQLQRVVSLLHSEERFLTLFEIWSDFFCECFLTDSSCSMFHVIVTVRRDDVELVGVEIWGLPSHYQSIIVNILIWVCVCVRARFTASFHI